MLVGVDTYVYKHSDNMLHNIIIIIDLYDYIIIPVILIWLDGEALLCFGNLVV